MPSSSYRPSDLVDAFEAAWKVIGPRRKIGSRQEERLRLGLAKCIITLAENGIHNSEEMRRQAIEQMILAPPSEPETEGTEAARLEFHLVTPLRRTSSRAKT